MMTSKERAELRSRANELETTLMVGKEGVSLTLLEEAGRQLDARELIKGKVLEAALMSAREVCDALCDELGAEGIQVVGNKFVIYRFSEKKAQEEKKAAAVKVKAKKKVNPVRAGVQKRRKAARQAREQRNEYFKQAAIEQAKQRRRAMEEEGE